MKPRYILPAILTLAASTIASAADSSPAYNFLNIPSSARVYGLGGINISSIDDDINSIDQNPALLGPEFEMQVGVNYMRYISDANFAGVKFGTKASEHGAWAVGLQYYGYGEITGTDETGTLTGNFSPKDVNFNGTYSHDITDRLRGGIALKMLYSSYGEYSAFAVATDLGINYYDPDRDLPFEMGPKEFDEFTAFDKKDRPIFPGYKFENGKSIYRGEEVGEGGYVYAEPGMYGNIALLDIASMHPSSIIAEVLFGPEFTKRFQEIRDARVAIKHKDFEKAKKMLNGALAKYLTDEGAAADLAQALKIAINSVYGLTSASFENPFRDNRNKDNIVAKRGALFMVNLKHEVQKRGFTVAHIKTDSIKIPDATPEIIKFVMDYGEKYGYTFEHEATYDRMCLVNNAVYIAKYKDGKHAGEWTATGTQFQIPYVFKKLFSHEEITFEDMCETKSVTSALYLDMNEDLPDVSEEEKAYTKLLKEIGDTSRLTDPMTKECQEFERLGKIIADGHSYTFVGKVGQFCPIKPGCNGGLLLREVIDKKTGAKSYAAATGAKGYRWLESEMVKQLEKEDGIDRSYYDAMVDEAVHDISQYGDFEWFVSDDPYVQPNPSDDIPPWETPGEPWQAEPATAFDVR